MFHIEIFHKKIKLNKINNRSGQGEQAWVYKRDGCGFDSQSGNEICNIFISSVSRSPRNASRF